MKPYRRIPPHMRLRRFVKDVIVHTPFTKLVLALLVSWLLAPGGSAREPFSTAPGMEQRRVAVFPFENLGAPEDEYFADGITEEITSRLAALRDLGVISRTSAFQGACPAGRLPRALSSFAVQLSSSGWYWPVSKL